ncbi:FecR protein [Pedobacter steynii]|uniref:FecR protein n=1 Tax=Pedobacter steynii TaxID=430522 RepID=A0A1G9NKF5_9SPHI|nr:FecR family protein [Pedobacter steynii]NQX39274.1 FecR domain-containing protein [Pedobacter steynii]SDL86850.1 FecR protein [Pedobacter steynii]
MEFQDYQIEDFLTDESFLNYCAKTNENDVLFWQNFKRLHQDKISIIEEAEKLFEVIRKDVKNSKQYKRETEQFKLLIQDHIAKTTPRKLGAFHQKYSYRYPLLVAASLILVIGLWLFNTRQASEPAAQQRVLLSQKAKKVKDIYAKRQLVLQDGSRVTLNSNSTLTVDKDFNVSKRIVRLTGEALFEIAKNQNKPFIVKSGNISITALGTSFMVRRYAHETKIKVLLLTGKVKVERLGARLRGKRNRVYLTPGLQVIINNNDLDNALKKQDFDKKQVLIWKNDELIFDDTPFDQVIAKLSDWYGVNIQLVNEPKETKHFTGDFKNKSLIDVLEVLGFAHQFKYSIYNNQIKIQFKP